MSKKHDIIWLQSVDSTNEEAKRHISDIDNLSVLSALEQTAGRGQRGNTWTSTPGENLMFSIVLKDPKISARDQFVLNEIASLSVVDFLSMHGISARIKWPNDIYVGLKKICGILIENSLQGSAISSSIIGIGLNINQRNFNVNLPNPTSMILAREENTDMDSEAFDLNELLEEFMDIFTEYLDRFCHITGGYNRLSKLYHAQLWRLNEPAEFVDTARNVRFHGIIRGTSPIGHLLVELPDGTTREFAFKEISYGSSKKNIIFAKI